MFWILKLLLVVISMRLTIIYCSSISTAYMIGGLIGILLCVTNKYEIKRKE